jgi:hypothetical protein
MMNAAPIADAESIHLNTPCVSQQPEVTFPAALGHLSQPL